MGDWRQARPRVGSRAAGLRQDSLHVVRQHLTERIRLDMGRRFVLILCDEHYEKVRRSDPEVLDWLITVVRGQD